MKDNKTTSSIPVTNDEDIEEDEKQDNKIPEVFKNLKKPKDTSPGSPGGGPDTSP